MRNLKVQLIETGNRLVAISFPEIQKHYERHVILDNKNGLEKIDMTTARIVSVPPAYYPMMWT